MSGDRADLMMRVAALGRRLQRCARALTSSVFVHMTDENTSVKPVST